jgi:hypothetical protein
MCALHKVDFAEPLLEGIFKVDLEGGHSFNGLVSGRNAK